MPLPGYLHLTRISGETGLARTVERHIAIMDAVLSGDEKAARESCEALIACGIEMIDELERQIDPHFLDIRYVPLTRGEAKSAAGIVT